jgi:hypothetical protein
VATGIVFIFLPIIKKEHQNTRQSDLNAYKFRCSFYYILLLKDKARAITKNREKLNLKESPTRQN